VRCCPPPLPLLLRAGGRAGGQALDEPSSAAVSSSLRPLLGIAMLADAAFGTAVMGSSPLINHHLVSSRQGNDRMMVMMMMMNFASDRESIQKKKKGIPHRQFYCSYKFELYYHRTTAEY
jgi:hypothetical protein